MANKKETTADDGSEDCYLLERLFRLCYYCQAVGLSSECSYYRFITVSVSDRPF